MAARPARTRCQPAARSARSYTPAAARIQPARLLRSCAAGASGIASSCCLIAEGPYRSSSCGGSRQATGGDASMDSATARSAASVRERLVAASLVSVCDAQRRRISSSGLGPLSRACSLSPQVSSCPTERPSLWSLPFSTSAGGASPYGTVSSAVRRTEAHRAHGLDASSSSSPSRWRTERSQGEGGILAEWRPPCSVWVEGTATSSCRRFVGASMP